MKDLMVNFCRQFLEVDAPKEKERLNEPEEKLMHGVSGVLRSD